MNNVALKTPWDGIGIATDSKTAPAKLIKQANLDWEVEKVPAFVVIDGKPHSVNTAALVRKNDHRILKVVSNDITPIQNYNAMVFFTDAIKKCNLQFQAAGTLRDGEYSWALAKMDDSIEVIKGDVIQNYLLFTNYNDFVDVRFSPMRLASNSILVTAAEKKGSTWLKMMKQADFDFDKVATLMESAKKSLVDFKETVDVLKGTKYTEASLNEYLAKVFPIYTMKAENADKQSKNAKMALQMLPDFPGSQYGKGTWWQAFNIVPFLLDHQVGRSQDNRLIASWYGQSRYDKLQALNLALKYAATK